MKYYPYTRFRKAVEYIINGNDGMFIGNVIVNKKTKEVMYLSKHISLMDSNKLRILFSEFDELPEISGEFYGT